MIIVIIINLLIIADLIINLYRNNTLFTLISKELL